VVHGDPVTRISTRDRKLEKIEELQEALWRLSDQVHEHMNVEIKFQVFIDFQTRLFNSIGKK
jgi:tRNA U34 5-carboxymethylaminomethyl modifying enzyme MnmG/GidA